MDSGQFHPSLLQCTKHIHQLYCTFFLFHVMTYYLYITCRAFRWKNIDTKMLTGTDGVNNECWCINLKWNSRCYLLSADYSANICLSSCAARSVTKVNNWTNNLFIKNSSTPQNLYYSHLFARLDNLSLLDYF